MDVFQFAQIYDLDRAKSTLYNLMNNIERMPDNLIKYRRINSLLKNLKTYKRKVGEKHASQSNTYLKERRWADNRRNYWNTKIPFFMSMRIDKILSVSSDKYPDITAEKLRSIQHDINDFNDTHRDNNNVINEIMAIFHEIPELIKEIYLRHNRYVLTKKGYPFEVADTIVRNY